MKILFMGTPDFAVEALDKLIQSEHEVVGVVTQPDKPKGRSGKMQFTPVKELALKYNIPVYQPRKVREEEFLQVLKQIQFDVIVVVAFGQILPKALLDMPEYGCVNVHGSLLPRWRGSAPIQWAVISGDKSTGVTTMMMDEGIDTGDILLKKEIKIDPKETGGSLFEKLSKTGSDLLIDTLKEIQNGTIKREKQKDEETCYAKILTKELGRINFEKSAIEIERLVRGLNPWPSAYTSYEGKMMKIWDTDVCEKSYDGEPGEIVDVLKDTFYVKTGEGVLEIKELQLEGKKRMKTEDFLRGYSVKTGEKLI